MNAAVLPGVSPCSTYLSPRRVTRRSLALAQTPVQHVHTPAHLRLTLRQTPEPKSQCGTPQATHSRRDTVNISMDFSPVKEVISDDTQTDGCPAQVSEKVSTDIPSVPQLLPAICLVKELDEPAEDVTVDGPVSPAVPVSPCKQPAVSPAPEPSSALSFTLSPCATPSQPSVSSPAVQGLVETLCHTPDSTVVEVNKFLFFFPILCCASDFVGWGFVFKLCNESVQSRYLLFCNFRKFLDWILRDTSSPQTDAA